MSDEKGLRPASVVTLLSDFGLVDAFVGVLKGAMLQVNPDLRIVDLCHSVEPQNIRQAAFMLMTSFAYFPVGTIHVAVVDPGVGTGRKILACQTDRFFFLAPDNGLLGPVLEREPLRACVTVTNARYFRPHVSQTFHGRDIFAPVAAYLSRGVPLSELGPTASPTGELHFPRPRRADDFTLRGEVLYTDRFGNLVTNLHEEEIRQLAGEGGALEVRVGGSIIPGLSTSYGAERAGILLAVVGSTGFLEVALNLGSAREFLAVDIGAAVEVRRLPARPPQSAAGGPDSGAGTGPAKSQAPANP
jgi:hypothetical protein